MWDGRGSQVGRRNIFDNGGQPWLFRERLLGLGDLEHVWGCHVSVKSCVFGYFSLRDGER